MGSFELLEHTADVGIRAKGASLEELFEQASRGLADIIGIWRPPAAPGRDALGNAQSSSIDLRARDIEALLVDWLGEIVYLSDVANVFLSRVLVEAVRGPGGSSGDCRATGRLWLEPRTGDEMLGTPVKAITYHGLEVVSDSTGWTAEVYVDV